MSPKNKGTFLFFFGFYINIDSDNRLILLRKNSKSGSGYQIPRGGFFEYVSAANYFGECLEWFGFALASWSLPALAFSVFTFSNIGPRGYHHHL
jgi:steroid 5-alpha reductase family enzyme